MRKCVPIIGVVLLVFLFNACLVQIPTQFESTQLSKRSFELIDEVDAGHSRLLKKGTSWHYVGTISHGDVFKTNDQILTVKDSNIHEAYIVVTSSKLVGFYLPVEKSFSPLDDSEELKIKEINPN